MTMTYFPSPPEDAGVRHILQLNPRAGRALKTREPTRMVASDALAVFEAGWSERDLHDAVLTVGLYRDRGAALARDGYAPLLAYPPDAGEAYNRRERRQLDVSA
jgi:hypothetical protein